MKSLFTIARSGNSTTATTGVRGLSEVDLQNAKPAPAELQKLDSFATAPADAQRFAAAEGLGSRTIGYLPKPAEKK